MNRVVCVMAGVFVGAAVAGSLVLLFTPQSGVDTQRLFRERVEAILAEGREAARARQIELSTQFKTLKR
jgi:gas vesicle protein